MKKYLSILSLLPKTNLTFRKVSMKILSVVTILMMVIGTLNSTVALAASNAKEISLQQEFSPVNDSFVLRDPVVSDPVLPADTTGMSPAPAVDLFDPKEDSILVMPNARTPDDFEARKDDSAIIYPALQLELGDVSMPAPITNWEGISATGVLPPDTDGQVGPNHYVQIVNAPGVGSQVRIWNKSGTQLHNFGLGNLWPGGDPCNSDARGDPVVLYDQLADRWLLTQFALPDPPFYECIAVSKTGTPTNNPNDWHLYSFLVHNTKMNDYPKLGVWPDGYYMSANQFTTGYAGVGVWVFDRAKMLNGDPATFQYFDIASINSNYWAFLPSNLMGNTLPPNGSPNYFVSMDQNWSGSDDILHIFEFHTDWANPANTTFSLVADLIVAPFDNDLCLSVRERCIHQPDGAPQLEALSFFLMMHLWYRNFGSHESLVVNSTVDADGTGRAGIRWLEVRGGVVDTTLADATIYQQGTYAPDDGLHRWMGSIAMDKFGNMALGYSVSSTSVYPSIRYAGRFEGDPLGTLPQAEVQIIAGSGVQTHSAARWGDYSAMSVDPVDDCTFWYTQEYIETSGSANWQTRIASFQFPACAGDIPDIVVDPSSISSFQPPDTIRVEQLNVRNVGGTDLDWIIEEEILQPAGEGAIDAKVAPGDPCVSPSDIPWLSIDPIGGTTPPGGNIPVDVTFDSTGIGVGTYDGNLCVESNDPDESVVVVPVTMTVEITPPDIQVDPSSIASTQVPDTMITKPLGISNIGDADLIWDIVEEEHPSTPQAGKGEWLYRAEEGVLMPFNGESEALAYPSAYRWQPGNPSTSLNILVYADDYIHPAPNTFPDLALQSLGLAYTAHYDSDFTGFETSLAGGTWDLVLFSNDSYAPPASVWTALESYINSGGKLILNTWHVSDDPTNSLWSSLGFTWVADDFGPPNPVFWWVPGHPFFTNPESVPEFTTLTDEIYGRYGEYVEPLPGFEALAGYTAPGPDPNQAAVIHGNGSRTVFKGFLDGQNDANLDADGLKDGIELWINMITGIGAAECIPGNIPWVSVDPTNGITPSSGTDTVDVTFDSTGLGAGVYVGNLCVNSNDPDESLFVVPLALTVEPEPPDIEIDPPALFSEQPPGEVEVDPLEISNVGGEDLDWEIIEELPPVTISSSGDDITRGDAAPSLGLPPVSAPPGSSMSSEPFKGLLAPGSDAYATESVFGNFTQFDLDVPEVLNTVAPYTTTAIWAGDFQGADLSKTYAIRDDSILVTLDTVTGIENIIGAVPAPPNLDEVYTGMAYDPTTGTMYASSSDCTISRLYIVDLVTPTTTMIGQITNAPCMIAIAVDDAGQMYGHEIVNDVLMSINKATGAGTIIGSLGFDANYGQGMDFDSTSGQLYLAAFNFMTFQAELRVADVTTGATALVGVLGQTTPGVVVQLGWLANASGGGCIPGDIPWISVSPMMGTTLPGGTDTLDVTFDSTGLIPGTYEGNLCVLSNDPDESLIVVPVTLETTYTTSTVGLYDYLGGNFYLRNEHAGGVADEAFRFGPKNAGWVPIAGDWDDDGDDTVGLYVPISGNFYLRNEHAGGAADEAFRFGPKNAGWVPITGDWDGDGVDTVGLYNPVGGNFYLRNVHAGGVADEVFGFGPKNAGWVPIVGDWDGDGVDTVGLYNPEGGHFYLRNAHVGGVADESFRFGAKNAGWVPIAGDWDADGIDTVGLYNPVGGNFYLKNSHTGGVADEAFRFGPKNVYWIPIAGDWDGS